MYQTAKWMLTLSLGTISDKCKNLSFSISFEVCKRRIGMADESLNEKVNETKVPVHISDSELAKIIAEKTANKQIEKTE